MAPHNHAFGVKSAAPPPSKARSARALFRSISRSISRSRALARSHAHALSWLLAHSRSSLALIANLQTAQLLRFSLLGNMVGAPSIVFPVAQVAPGSPDAGLPIAMMLTGRWWEEHTLLRLAHAAEVEWHENSREKLTEQDTGALAVRHAPRHLQDTLRAAWDAKLQASVRL